MKILHTVEFYDPSKGGAQEVVKQLSERMAAAGHEVTVATSKIPERNSNIINGVKIKEFAITGNAVRGYKGPIDSYKKYLADSNFDIVMNYAAQQWATDLAFEVIDKINAKKVLVPCGYSALGNKKYIKYFKKMPSVLRKYDASVYLSPTYQDVVFAKKNNIQNLHIITNGANEREFKTVHKSWSFKKKYGIKHFFILSIGSHTNAKGHSEAMDVFEHFPYPCTLVIIGNPIDGGCWEACHQRASVLNHQKRRRKKKIILLDLSREETITALKTADLFLFLSNIEASPLVLFESAAAGTPFVASAAGNAEEIANWTKGGLITKTIPHPGRDSGVSVDIQHTVDLLKILWRKPIARRLMGKRGRKNWRKKYTWEIITKQYLDLYNSIGK